MHPLFITNTKNINNYNNNPFFTPFMHPYSIYCCHEHASFCHLNNKEIMVQCDHEGKGKWTKRQELSYVTFLANNFQQMKEKSLRKSQKVFVKMSKGIRTRTPDQCRSHHQKVLHIYRSLQDIIRLHHDIKFPQKGGQQSQKLFKTENTKTKDTQSQNKLYTLTKKQNCLRYQIIESRISIYQ